MVNELSTPPCLQIDRRSRWQDRMQLVLRADRMGAVRIGDSIRVKGKRLCGGSGVDTNAATDRSWWEEQRIVPRFLNSPILDPSGSSRKFGFLTARRTKMQSRRVTHSSDGSYPPAVLLVEVLVAADERRRKKGRRHRRHFPVSNDKNQKYLK